MTIPRHVETFNQIQANRRRKRRTGVMVDVPDIGFEDDGGDTIEVRLQKLAQVRREIHDCRLCPLAGMRLDRAWAEASKTIGGDKLERTITMARAKGANVDDRVYYERFAKAVPGEGAPDARVMIVGEAPGFYEEQASSPADGRFGRPFVGPSGRELERMLERAGLTREDVYIANTLSCRPPENRDPAPGEMRPCVHGLRIRGQTAGAFLRRQIAIVRPWLIVIMGRYAARTLLETEEGVGALRGRVFDYPWSNRLRVPIRAIVTYHPAAILRNWIQGIPVDEEDWALISAMLKKARQRYAPEAT